MTELSKLYLSGQVGRNFLYLLEPPLSPFQAFAYRCGLPFSVSSSGKPSLIAPAGPLLLLPWVSHLKLRPRLSASHTGL